MAVRTKALDRLWKDFDARFPGRDRSSDGWIGDRAHQVERSGHNPDDTPGSLPEYEDADSIAEVRAIDIDADLGSGVTMQQVADAIVKTAADRERVAYLILNRRIIGDHTGWKWQRYTGGNPHTSHLHVSGKPGKDDAAGPWRSVLDIGKTSGSEDDMANAADVIKKLDELIDMVRDANPGPGKEPTSNGGISRVRTVGIVQEELRNQAQQIKDAIGQIGTGAAGGATTPGGLGQYSTNDLLAEIQKRATR